MSEENLARQRSRLLAHESALDALAALGLQDAALERFALGLKEPYRPRGDAPVVEHALSFPVRGADGSWLSRFAFMGIEGVTSNAPAPGFWGVGPPLSYWRHVGNEAGKLLVASDPLSVWLLDGLLGEGSTEYQVVCPSHPGPLPEEWADARFWEDWDDVVLLADEATDRVVDSLPSDVVPKVRCADVPLEGSSWLGTLRGGLSSAVLLTALEDAQLIECLGIVGSLEGDFDFDPVEVGSLFRGGMIYYPYRVEERRLEAIGSGRGARKVLVQRYATRVLRSDGAVLKVEELPAPAGSRPDERVLALSDGTRITREPVVAESSSWSFASIRAFARDGAAERNTVRTLDCVVADVELFVRAAVWLPREDDYALLVAYVLTSFVYPVFDAVPILVLQGGRGTGKTELGMVLADLSRNGVVAGQTTAAGLARLVDEARGLVVLDDLEAVSTAAGGFTEIGQVLKTGYKKSSARKSVVDRAGRVTSLDFYGPKVVSNTRGVEPVIRSRSVVVRTASMPPEVAAGRTASEPPVDATELRDELHCWAMRQVGEVHREARRVARPTDRDAEIALPLLAVSALVGERFSARVRAALEAQKDGAVVRRSPVEVVSAAVRSEAVGGWVSMPQLQLELAMEGHPASDVSPESVGRLLVAEDFKDAERDPARLRLNGQLVRVIPVPAPAAEASDPSAALDFCRSRSCGTCRYVHVCAATLPDLKAGKT